MAAAGTDGYLTGVRIESHRKVIEMVADKFERPHRCAADAKVCRPGREGR